MYSLFRAITKPTLHCVLIIGPSGSGKTSLMYRLCGREYTDCQPTIGLNTMVCGGGVMLMDLGGSMLHLWLQYAAAAEAIILVLDRVECAERELEAIGRQLHQPVPVLVFVNKHDDPLAPPSTHPNIVFGSARSGSKVQATLDWVKQSIAL